MKKDCSNILVYKEERKRMCEFYYKGCDDCKLNDEDCRGIYAITPEFIEIVQKWSDEHPVKTRQSELLKLFPNLRYEDYIGYCPIDFDSTFECIAYTDCDDCQKKFWLQEVE